MAKDSAPDYLHASQCVDEMPEQTEPGTYDIVRQEARDEVRLCLAKMGFDISALEVIDTDEV